MDNKPLVLAVPPTANTYWRSRVIWSRKLKRQVVQRYKTQEADNYQRAVFIRAYAAGWRPIKAPREVVLSLTWYRGSRGDGDLDNRLKVVIDALQGAAYDNDSQVRKIIAERFEDPDRPRLEVSVEEVKS